MNSTGLTEKTRTAFLIYLISHNRPMAELLEPQFQPLTEIYEKEFQGMAKTCLRQLEKTRSRLVDLIRSSLSDKDKEFLLSVKNGTPAWELLDVPHGSELPAVRWKLHNIEQLKRNPDKHAEAVSKLRRVLELGWVAMPTKNPALTKA